MRLAIWRRMVLEEQERSRYSMQNKLHSKQTRDLKQSLKSQRKHGFQVAAADQLRQIWRRVTNDHIALQISCWRTNVFHELVQASEALDIRNAALQGKVNRLKQEVRSRSVIFQKGIALERMRHVVWTMNLADIVNRLRGWRTFVSNDPTRLAAREARLMQRAATRRMQKVKEDKQNALRRQVRVASLQIL